MHVAWPRRLLASWIALAAGVTGGAVGEDEPRAPLDVGLEEEVEVRLVLVDFVVLDRNERTVPDLSIDDLVVLAGGREVDIASLDRDCPVGAAGDPVPGATSPTLPSAPTARPRRIVLVFDYYHMTNVAEAFDRVGRMLDKWPIGDEEHMVVSLGDVLRVEAPFTADLQEVRRALRRMRQDPDLYAGNYGRLTEHRFFDRMEMLLDLLARWEGRKTVVLFSGPFLADGFFHDPQFKALSGLATTTRSAVYPVDTGGLRTLLDPGVSRLGGPAMLRRLANETGGRMTADTNEIGVAYAKAHRDLGCTYTVGFHDPWPSADRKRRLTIRVEDDRRLRVVYPEFYVVRSPQTKRRAQFRAAAMAPQPFDSDEIAADLFLLRPRSPSRWRALVGVEVRRAPNAPIDGGRVWELKGLVRKPRGTLVHSFKRKVPVPAVDPATGRRPTVAVFHDFRLRPGRYVVSAVLSDPGAEAPIATTRRVVAPEIPRGEPFLIGPILGRSDGERAEADGRDRPDFEPLVVREAERGEPLDSLTVVCAVRADGPVELPDVRRALTTPEGRTVRRLDPVSLRLSGGSPVSCSELVDRLETVALEPGRYELEVRARSERAGASGDAAFTLLRPTAPPDPPAN